MIVQLNPSESSDFYNVQTGYFSSRIKKDKLLWEKPKDSLPADSERAPSNQRKTSPNVNSGEPVNLLSSDTAEKSSSDEERLAEFTGIIEKLLPVLQDKKGARKVVGKKLSNGKFNIIAVISGKSLGKLVSEKALNKSVSPKIHALAVANIDRLFENAPIDIIHPDYKNDTNTKQIHRLGTLLEFENEHYPVMITVKEFVQKADGTRIYSVEAVDIQSVMNSTGQLPSSQYETGRSGPITEFNTKILELYDNVKGNFSGTELFHLDESGNEEVDFNKPDAVGEFAKENPDLVAFINAYITQ